MFELLAGVMLIEPVVFGVLADRKGITAVSGKSGWANVAWITWFSLGCMLITGLGLNLLLLSLDILGVPEVSTPGPDDEILFMITVILLCTCMFTAVYFSKTIRAFIKDFDDGLSGAYSSWCDFITGRK